MQERTHSFGYWLKRRRKALDLTQEALGQRVSCSGFTIRKIEADERRPSRGLAERLAKALAIPEEEQRTFLDVARAQRTTHDLQLDPTPVDAISSNVSAPASFLSNRQDVASDTTPFVGRDSEYGQLTRLIARLTSGEGYTVLIEGEPGIGKSRLLREVARYALSHELPTLVTKCYEIERAMPYQSVIDLVTRVLERIPDSELQRLPPVSLAELAALIPEIGERFPDLPQLSNDFPEARQARLSHAVDQLLEASRGHQPFVFVVDDIQWADDASAHVLHYLARQAAQRATLILYTYRDEAIDSDERFAQWVESLRRDSHAQHVSLGRLGYNDTASLVATLDTEKLALSDLAKRLHKETDGNPFFITSILESILDGETQLASRTNDTQELLPNALRAAVRARLSHVPKTIRPLLDTAAVIGRRFDFDTLLEVSGQPEDQLLDAVEELIRRRLLREEIDSGLYDFSHDKVREVTYREISGARRRSLHRSVAELLEQRSDESTHDRDARLAEHYERAQIWSKALHYLVLAADRSQHLFAMRDALHWLDRAVALCESHPEAIDKQKCLAIYEQRGGARAQAGQTQGAVADIRRVIDALRASGDKTKTRDALIQLGMAYRRADQYDEATACLTEALRESRLMNDDRHAADTLYHLGTVAWSTGNNHQAIGFHQQAVDICERMGFTDLVAVQAYHGRGEAHYANAEPAAAIECYTRSLQLARGIGDKSYESENLMMIGHACIGSKGLGDYPRALENFNVALEIAQAADLQWHFGPTLLGIDHVNACIGHYGEAWANMQKTLQWLESLNQVRYQFIALDSIAHLLLDLELNEQVVEFMERGLRLSRDTGIQYWRAALDTHLAVAQSRLGHKTDLTALQDTLKQTLDTAERYMMVRVLGGLAEIMLTAGDTTQCRTYADELLDLAEANGLRENEAIARRWRGEALLTENHFEKAQAELSRAAEIAEDIGRVRLQLDTHTALAQLFTAQGQHESAQQHTDRAAAAKGMIANSLASSGLDVSPSFT